MAAYREGAKCARMEADLDLERHLLTVENQLMVNPVFDPNANKRLAEGRAEIAKLKQRRDQIVSASQSVYAKTVAEDHFHTQQLQQILAETRPPVFQAHAQPFLYQDGIDLAERIT